MTAPAAPRAATPATYSGDARSFIETQFPVSKLSKESYKERKANHGQTLTGLGKWWGRKPLVLVRATILGLLLPTTGDAKRDREIFLKLLTMDEDGLWRRKSKGIALARLLELLTPVEVRRLYGTDVPTTRQRLTPEIRDKVQQLAFGRMSYDERLEYCDRPEQVDGPSAAAWAEINAHLGTSADSLPTLVRELGVRRWGRTPRVGDAFCGGGSIPFEAARIGCEAYGSDLNPVAALLTWAALNVVGGGEAVAREVREAQRAVYDAVDRQVTEWGIEHNEQGWRADAYLYCAEVTCPECGVRVPLAPSWVIGERTKTVASLRQRGGSLRDRHREPRDRGRDARPRSRTARRATTRCTARRAGSRRPSPCYAATDAATRPGCVCGRTRTWRPGLTMCSANGSTACAGSRRTATAMARSAHGGTTARSPQDDEQREAQGARTPARTVRREWQEVGLHPEPADRARFTTRISLSRERGWAYWHQLFNASSAAYSLACIGSAIR